MSAGTCPGCGADEVEAMTPCTVYACGTTSYDDRDGTWFGPCAEVNCCEHGDHPAPEGKRFCSAACRECECAPCAPGDNGCTGICRAAKVSR